MFILLCDRGAITTTLRNFEPLLCHYKISLSVVPNGTTNELADLFFTLSRLILSVMQGSYKYQLLSHWFNPTLNRIPSLSFQKQTLYPLGHLCGNNFIWFTTLDDYFFIFTKCFFSQYFLLYFRVVLPSVKILLLGLSTVSKYFLHLWLEYGLRYL